ncbi:MAG: hypothetical protein JWM16_3743 [Verrucomicrobiales bacterium]|nr:hypothetical protein [Verrucomicrobiales bacterium]
MQMQCKIGSKQSSRVQQSTIKIRLGISRQPFPTCHRSTFTPKPRQSFIPENLAHKLYPTATNGNERRVSARSPGFDQPSLQILMYAAGSRACARENESTTMKKRVTTHRKRRELQMLSCPHRAQAPRRSRRPPQHPIAEIPIRVYCVHSRLKRSVFLLHPFPKLPLPELLSQSLK